MQIRHSLAAVAAIAVLSSVGRAQNAPDPIPSTVDTTAAVRTELFPSGRPYWAIRKIR